MVVGKISLHPQFPLQKLELILQNEPTWNAYDIMILTPYKAQESILKEKLADKMRGRGQVNADRYVVSEGARFVGDDF